MTLLYIPCAVWGRHSGYSSSSSSTSNCNNKISNSITNCKSVRNNNNSYTSSSSSSNSSGNHKMNNNNNNNDNSSNNNDNDNLREFALCYERHPESMRGKPGLVLRSVIPFPGNAGNARERRGYVPT